MRIVSRMAVAGSLALLVTPSACRSDRIVSVPDRVSRTVSIAVGQELHVTLGTVGPGAYDSLPAISSPALRFLDMTYPAAQVPAGPTQLFRFIAAARGTAIVSFHHSGTNPPIQDTVIVR